MSSASGTSVSSPRGRRSSSRDIFLAKLRSLEDEYRRSRSRRKRGKSPRGRSRSPRRRRRSRGDDSDKENGERIADPIRRPSRSSRNHYVLARNRRDHSFSASDKESGERYPRDASRSSRRHSSDRERSLSAQESEKEKSPEKPTPADGKVPIALNASTLDLLGDDPSKYEQTGPDIHLAVAERWEKILRDGLPKEQKRDLQEKYPTIGNCRLTKAPKLNLEVKAALSALAIKKDTYQFSAQNQLGAGINAIGAALTEVLKAESSTEQTIDTSKFIERLADAGRILSDLHHDMSKARRSFIVPALNAIVKSIADDSAIDSLLFGENFSENLKAAKATEKSSKDLVKQKGEYRRSFGADSREDNRRFQSTRPRSSGYSSQQRFRSNWRRPSATSHRGTQRKGQQKSKDFRSKDSRQNKE